MRKVSQYILLIAGIVVLVYSLGVPVGEALMMSELSSSVSSSTISPGFGTYFLLEWQGDYSWLTAVGGIVTLSALVLKLLFRKSRSTMEPLPAVLLGGGAMVELVALLQAWARAMEIQNYSYNMSDGYLSSGLSSAVDVPSTGYFTVVTEHSIWECLKWGYEEHIWLVLMGAVMLVLGIVFWIRDKRKPAPAEQEQVPETTELEPVKEVPEVKITEREEWRITLLCTVMDIRGDYALVKYDDSGVESEVAIALLPLGVDTGDRLKYENYEFERV